MAELFVCTGRSSSDSFRERESQSSIKEEKNQNPFSFSIKGCILWCLEPERDNMEKQQPQKQSQIKGESRSNLNSEEVTSLEWEVIKMSEQEEDLIYRMHRLVGDRWDLIAGRIPGRTAVEIERFWILKHASA